MEKVFSFLLAVWTLLGGGLGCGNINETFQTATSDDRSYTLSNEDLDASNAYWVIPYEEGGPGITLSGSGNGAMFGGAINGPMPETAVYECSSEHCPPGGCPSNCIEYHTSEGVEHELTGHWTYNDLCISDEGDGISATQEAGPFSCSRCYMTGIHDDAMEHDWCGNISIFDTLINDAFMAMATNPRSGDSVDCEDATISIVRSYVSLTRYTNTYKQKEGHGGLYKRTVGNAPKQVLKSSIIKIGPIVGNGQETVPVPSLFERRKDCYNNWYLFDGTQTQLNAWLDDEDELDNMTNRERLNALDYCIDLIARPAGQTSAQFLAQWWDPFINEWKTSHVADDSCSLN
jgi:hypothetical protein